MSDPMRKSARAYRRMLTNPALRGKAPEHPEWRAVAAYLRELYREYGRDRVRVAIRESVK